MAEQQTESPTVSTAPSAATATVTVTPTEAAELTAARNLVLKANPNAVPELVTGATIAELEASAANATAVYQRIRDNIAGVADGSTPPVKQTEAAPANVPAGAAAFVVDLNALPPSELIKRGMAARRAQSSHV